MELYTRQKKMFCYRSAGKQMSGRGDFFFLCEISEKSLIFTNFPHFARTIRGSAWTTCRATSQRHITREFGLKSNNKMSGGGEKKAKKNVYRGATVTKHFFLCPI